MNFISFFNRLSEIEELLEKFEKIVLEYWNDHNRILNLLVDQKQSSLQRVKYLVANYQGTSQRTAEWYARRETCITASDISAVLGTSKYRNLTQVVLDKCGHRKFKGNFYTEWGQRYEPIATMIYEYLYKCKIYEAPLLIHPIFPFVGASTDGFIIDEKNKEGALIEIKCPYARIPKEGIIPKHYWEQPQTQMEVAKVNKAYFFDCRFEEYLNKEDYLNEQLEQPIIKGLLLEYLNQNTDKICYLYPETLDETDESLEFRFNQLKNVLFSRIIYWKLVKMVKLEIPRDQRWFQQAIPRIQEYWNLIKEHRSNQLSEDELRESLKKYEKGSNRS